LADTFSRQDRSAIMRAVRGKDTSLEVRFRSTLWRRGFRYRKHVRGLPGNPDIVFSRQRLCVFIDSCFWHGCPAHLRRPKSNEEYWTQKIDRNVARDRAATAELLGLGWQVLRIWEHDLREDFLGCVDQIVYVVQQPHRGSGNMSAQAK
jgi:DNA mismatch endonuclease (patch repair protein)